ncbi:MAG: FkbM family methyltransferase, partial [Acetobacteraceae bacterium]
MTFISYAQNFEDVLLWRALRRVEAGFYIDVGAAHPDTDSVTRAFYDSGWRGIDIEPVPELARRIRAARPRDIVIEAAAVATEAAQTQTLFVVPGTGLSTLHPRVLGRCAGLPSPEPLEVAGTTLAAICRAHAPDDIHFLKVDVEGGERAVLAGADFQAFRPWIVLVEATEPLSQRAAYATWEGLLLSAGYRFLWYDGLNRFYAAAERYAEIAPHFSLPPNVFDDFLRVADSALTRRIAELEVNAAFWRERASAAEQHAAAAASERSEAAELRHEWELELLRGRCAQLEAAVHDARRTVDLMRASTSWRLTAPLRRAVATLRGNRTARDRPVIAPVASPEGPRPAGPLPAARPEWPRRVIHQFHSATTTGDAITNAMLLTRQVLRGQGYESEIFVDHLDPQLAGEIRPLDHLPLRDDYVLILRHSLGFRAFDRVIALPAPKVLLYHNITPAHLLASVPELQRASELGRAQLAEMRPLVSAAMADSEYNAIELRRLGFDPVLTCTLLFDLDAMRAAARPKKADQEQPFTILFVGRVIESKAQADLVAAYARFRAKFDRPSRLVLVGRTDGAGDEYMRLLRDRIRDVGPQHVHLTGQVSDAELRGWYAAADLYVSLSRHEGFGVPLVEAIAAGVPVLAWPSGAVPYTIGAGAALLADDSPDAVATRMLELAQDGASRDAIRAHQGAALDRFRLERQVPALLSALSLAGAAPPTPADTAKLLAANARFTITGHVNKSDCLAAINRDLALAIEAERPGSVRIVPVEGGLTDDISDVPVPQAERIAALAARAKHPTGPEVVISQHYPVWVPPDGGDVPLALFFWEESLVPAETVATLNRAFRGVLAPSRFVANALVNSGASVPVHVIGHAPDLSAFRALARDRGTVRRQTAPFTFLHVSSCLPRKGVDVLLTAFARAFRPTDPVRLVIKGLANPHNDVESQIAALRARDPDMAEIAFINRDLDQAEMLDLYSSADALVLPTRGEGFNLPAAEAMAAGLPLIVTGYGGHMDFCREGNARLVRYRLAHSTSHVATPHSVWAEPDPDDLVAALREAASMRESDGRQAAAWAARARQAEADIEAATDRASLVRRLGEIGAASLMPARRAPMRLAWISTWNVRCGIAEYSRHLLERFPLDPREPVVVLADQRTAEETPEVSGIQVRKAWRCGDPTSLPDIADAVAAVDPNVVVVQHQPAFFAWDTLAALLGGSALRGRSVVAMLHNTRSLGEAAPATRRAVLAAMSDIDCVLVHTVADLNLLAGMGLRENVSLLPHGAAASAEPVVPRALGPDDAPLIGSYGFFLPRKGLPQL